MSLSFCQSPVVYIGVAQAIWEMLNYTKIYVITCYREVFLCKTLGLVADGMCFFSVSKPVASWLNAVAVLKGIRKPS